MNENLKPQKDSGGTEVSVLALIRLLLERAYWLVLAGTVTGLLTFLVFHFLVTPTYESSVSFYVYNSLGGVSQSDTIDNSDLQAAESLATTYSKILGSNSVLNAVLDDLGNEITRKELSRMTSVSVVNDTQLLEVQITSTDAEFACKVAQSFASVAPDEIVRITKAGGVEVVDRPEVATEQASPRTLFDTIIGVILGMILAAIAIILRAVSDTTIYLPEDIERLTGITVLGQVPQIDGKAEDYKYWTLIEGGVIRHEQSKDETTRGK